MSEALEPVNQDLPSWGQVVNVLLDSKILGSSVPVVGCSHDEQGAGQVGPRNGAVGKVQEVLGPEGVIALLVAVVVAGAREWRRVQLAREKRRVREQELLAEMVSDVCGDSRGR